ncbi:MAG: hypothetical protein JWM11_6821 [Planctomycetaceae bacterium]|nr:hypothetical protein [Planctomycetaceae bacterium]
MRNSSLWLNLFLVLAIGTCCGCGGNAAKNPAAGSVGAGAGAVAAGPGATAMPPGGPFANGQNPFAPNVPTPPALNLGAIPNPTKIDAGLQKRILTMAGPLKELAAKSALEAPVDRNDLKQIGLAFYSYEDRFQHLPALNGSGKKGAPHPGLSWRVMLLPFLGEQRLYQQFKIDEPWDSANNKPLIAQMPKNFGVNPEGKTRVHVLAGNGTLLKENEGRKTRDVSAGSTNTLLAVVGGPDTAEIWTKPGGLKYSSQEPLKCLGNIGDKFFVLSLDGATRQFPKTINPLTFAKFVQPERGKTIEDLDALNLIREAEIATPVFRAPVTPLAPTSQRLDLSYFPNDTFAALILHPRRICEHPIGKGILSLLPHDKLQPTAFGASYQQGKSINETINLLGQAGITPQNLDEIAILCDKDLVQVAMAGPGRELPSFGLIVRAAAPIDLDLLLSRLAEKTHSLTVQEFEGVTLVVSGPEKAAIACITDSMVLAGRVEFILKMIAAREQTAATSPVTKRLERTGNRLICLSVDAVPVESTLRVLAAGLPNSMSSYSNYILGVQELGLTFDLDAPELLQAQVRFKTPEMTTELFRLIGQQINQTKTQFPAWRQMLAADPKTQGFVGYFDQFTNETEIANFAGNLTLTVPRFKDLEKLPEFLKPLLDSAMQSPQLGVEKGQPFTPEKKK